MPSSLMKSLEPIFTIQDDRFQVEQLAAKSLLLVCMEEEIQLGVYNHQTEKLEWLEVYAASVPLNVLKEEHLFLKADFWKGIHVVIQTKEKSLLPKEYATVLPEEWKEKSYFLEVDSQKKLAFNVPENLLEFLKKTYENSPVTLYPADAFFLQLSDALYLGFEKDLVHVSFLENGELKQVGCLPFEILHEQIAAQFDSIKVCLYGNITNYSPAYVSLKFSQKQTVFCGILDQSSKLTQYFWNVPQHRYFILFKMLNIF